MIIPRKDKPYFYPPFLTFHVSGKKAQGLVIRSEFIFLLKRLLPSSSIKLTVIYGALCNISKAHPLSIALDFFLIFYPLYLNTLTISLSPPTSWLHLFNIPVSMKPHFSMTLPDAGFPVKWSAQMFSKCFSLMQ